MQMNSQEFIAIGKIFKKDVGTLKFTKSTGGSGGSTPDFQAGGSSEFDP